LPTVWIETESATAQGLYIIHGNASATGNLVEIDNDATGHGLYIHQDAVLASSKRALFVYSNAAQTNEALFRVENDNASSTINMAVFDNDGSGECVTVNQVGNGVALNVANSGTQDGIFISQNAVNAIGNMPLRIYSNQVQNTGAALVSFEMDNASASDTNLYLQQDGTGRTIWARKLGTSTGTAVEIDNDGTGNGLFIDQDGAGLALSINQASTTQSIYINQVGVLATGGAIDVYSDGVQNTADTALIKTWLDNASSDAACIQIRNDGTGPQIEARSNHTGNYLPYPWIKLGFFTHDTAVAGTQAITGVGFKPRFVFFMTVKGVSAGPGAGWGFDDGTTAHNHFDNQNITADTWSSAGGGASIHYVTGSGTGIYASIQSMDVDGFTLNWTKSGSPPSHTLDVKWFAIG
jgi:hypothetical protein